MDGFMVMGVVLGIYLILGPIFGIIAFARREKAADEAARDFSAIQALRSEVAVLRSRIEGIEAKRFKPAAPEQERAEEESADQPAQPQEREEEAPLSGTERPTERSEQAPSKSLKELRREKATRQAAAARLPVREKAVSDSAGFMRRLEEIFVARWLLWLGGITLTLAGVFLVKYSVEQGWLSPTVRVVLGALAGLSLSAAGEWLRRRPTERAIAKIRTNHAPAALTGAGLAITFTATYAAYGLYAMIAPLTAFLLLALIAAAAVVLALLHGPFIALLGLVGGYSIPALVSTDAPSAWALFPYLAVLFASLIVLVRQTGATWLAWPALAGASFWALLWFAAGWSHGDSPVLFAYILAMAALIYWPAWRDAEVAGAPAEDKTAKAVKGAKVAKALRPFAVRPRGYDFVGLAGGVIVLVLAFVYLRMEAYGLLSLLCLAILSLGAICMGVRRDVLDLLPPAAAVTAVLALLGWHLPRIVTQPEALYSIAGRDYGNIPGPLLPPELWPYLAWASLFAGLFGLAGYFLLSRGKRPLLWTGLSCLVPLAVLALAYWRITALEVDFAWAIIALALSGLYLYATLSLRARKAWADQTSQHNVVGVYASAVLGALALAAAMIFREAWLTVALSALLPGCAWIALKLDAPVLRKTAFAIAGLVLLRLLFNPAIFGYALGPLPLVNWILYGYGLPAFCFYLAARLFQKEKDDQLVALLEAGMLVFTTLLVSLEIRSLINGELTAGSYRFAEQALNSIAWGSLALGCYHVHHKGGRRVFFYAWQVLALLAAGQVFLVQCLLDNPLLSGQGVGEAFLFNLLGLAYLAPALIALAFAYLFRRDHRPRLLLAAGCCALVLLFVFLSLQVTHLFQGSRLSLDAVSQAESYSYSLVWLLFAAVLLAIALFRNLRSLRYASLAVLSLAIGKVFLVDMAHLTGLYRVASFFGLGLSLIAIGTFYHRYVFTPPPPADAGDAQSGAPHPVGPQSGDVNNGGADNPSENEASSEKSSVA